MTGTDNEDVTKLNIARLNGELYGRSKELSTLRQAYHRVSGCSSLRKRTCGIMPNESKEKKNGQIERSTGSNGTQTSPSEMVLVSGRSGVGKSSLIEKLREESMVGSHCASHYFVSGKFDQLCHSQPYSAVSEALNNLCDVVFRNEKGELTGENTQIKMADSIRKAVGSEGLKTLASNLPSIHAIVDYIDEKESRSKDTETASVASTNIGENDNSNFLRARDSFLFALRAFIRAICSNCCILVLFLDDLQWADPESINLIRSLLTDIHTRNILFVGAYREEELDINDHQTQDVIDYSSILGECLRDIETKGFVNVTKIHLKNLDKTSTNFLICNILRQHEEETMSLTDTVFRKTQGNAFFVMQFLEALQNEKLLNFSFVSCKWTWASDDEIQSTMSVSNNVAELMVKKIQRLPKESQSILIVAAALGFHFDEDVLKYILGSWQSNRNESIIYSGSGIQNCGENKCSTRSFLRIPKDANVQPFLIMAVEEGFLDKVVGAGSVAVYKFTHDRVQQVSLSLLQGIEEKTYLHLNIGDLLKKRLQSFDEGAREENQWLIFITANQLNLGADLIRNTESRVELARFNLRSAEIAAVSSAFVPASSYLTKAIKLLNGLDPWTKHYELILKICNLSAVMEYCTGNIEKCNHIISMILKNARSLQDKANAYITSMEAMLAKGGDLKETMDFGFHVLSLMGEKFPKKLHRRHLIKAFLKTKKKLKDMTDTDLLTLTYTRNEEMSAKMNVLGFLYGCCALMQIRHFPFIVFRLVQLSVDYGMCKYSPGAFAMYGSFLCGKLGDFKGGKRVAHLAISLEERLNGSSGSLTTFVVHKFINHLSEHLQKSLDPLLEKYEAGIRSGEMLPALMCAQYYCECYLYCGMPLTAVENDMRQYHQVMIEHEQTRPLEMLLPVWQFVLNLLGRSEKPMQLTGEVMDQTLFLKSAIQNKNSILATMIYSLQVELAYLFGDLKVADDLTTLVLRYNKDSMLSYHFCRFKCLQGLISLALIRKTQQRSCLDQSFFDNKQRKWKKISSQIMRQVKSWVECNAGNMLHLFLLLNAEHDSLSKSDEVVKRSFDEAIATAGRNGFLSDQALANERAGIFFLERGDHFWASNYLSRSHGLYQEWGAQSKVADMDDKYPSLIRSSKETVAMQGHRGKSRFVDATKHHKKIDVVGICQGQNTSTTISSS